MRPIFKIRNLALLLVVAIGLTAVFVFIKPDRTYAAIDWGKVLGVGDADDEQEFTSEENTNNEESTQDEDRITEDENNNNEIEKEVSDKDTEEHTIKSDDDNDSEDFDEIEKIIINTNGTKTIVKEEYEPDKTQAKIDTYGADGKKSDERIYKSEGMNKEKPMLKTYGIDNNKLSGLKYKTKSGEEVSLVIEDKDSKISRLYYDEDKNQLIVTLPEIGGIEVDNGSIDSYVAEKLAGVDSENIFNNDKTKVTLRAHNDDEAFEMLYLGGTAYTKYPLKVNDDTGVLYIVAADNDIEITVFPDKVKEKIDKYYKVSSDDSLELVSDNTNTNLVYQLDTEKTEKLLGLLDVKIPVLLQYNITTNELSESSDSVFAKVLDFISS